MLQKGKLKLLLIELPQNKRIKNLRPPRDQEPSAVNLPAVFVTCTLHCVKRTCKTFTLWSIIYILHIFECKLLYNGKLNKENLLQKDKKIKIKWKNNIKVNLFRSMKIH